jgi:hypothetical protein
MFMGQSMNTVNDPMAELAMSKKAFIKQKIELFEMFTGCETPNRYHVYTQNGQGQWSYLFKCKEKSGWCERNCLSSDSRPFDLGVKHIGNQNDVMNDDYTNSFATFNRPYKCTCCCLAR